MRNPDLSSGTNSLPSANVVGVLIVPQILASVVAVFYVAFGGMRVAGCAANCDYELDYAANVALWIAVAVITMLTLAGLIVWRRRRWKNWPITFVGVALTILAGVIADQVVGLAFVP